MKNEIEFIDVPEVEGWKPSTWKEDVAAFALLIVFVGLVTVALHVSL